MNQQTLSQIWTQVAKDMTYGDQINTFFLIDNPPDITLDTLGATYQDYLDGLFWSRDWVNGGANPNALKGQFPAIFAESTTNTIECLDDMRMLSTWAFVLVDKIPCDSCPNPDGITAPGLKDKLLRLLRVFLNEFLSYEHWILTIDAVQSSVWISAGRKAYFQTLGNVTLDAFIEDMQSLVEPVDSYTLTEWGNMREMRGYTASIVLSWCDDVSGSFDYSQETALNSGLVTCC